MPTETINTAVRKQLDDLEYLMNDICNNKTMLDFVAIAGFESYAVKELRQSFSHIQQSSVCLSKALRLLEKETT